MSCFSSQDEASRHNKAIEQQLKKDKDVYKSTHRLLLLGMAVCLCVCACVYLPSECVNKCVRLVCMVCISVYVCGMYLCCTVHAY